MGSSVEKPGPRKSVLRPPFCATLDKSGFLRVPICKMGITRAPASLDKVTRAQVWRAGSPALAFKRQARGISRCKLLCMGWINNKALLCGTGTVFSIL